MAKLKIGLKYPSENPPVFRGSRDKVKREYEALTQSLTAWKNNLGPALYEVRLGDDRMTIWLDEIAFYYYEDSRPLHWFDVFLGRVDDEKA